MEKSFEALDVKKFDIEISVDPLFKKTCADFDEAGAKGLLLNNLSLDVCGRIVFDAGDADLAIKGNHEISEISVDSLKMLNDKSLAPAAPLIMLHSIGSASRRNAKKRGL